MKINFYILGILAGLLLLSCTEDDINTEFRNATDCDLNPSPGFIGLCLNGSQFARPNDLLTYASKSTTNFSEIVWEITDGNMTIVSVENTTQANALKSVASIQFQDNFNGGRLKVAAMSANDSDFVEIMNFEIELED